MKYVTYYIVIDNDNDINNTKFYTVCQSKKDCEEFINTYQLLKYLEHYESWCSLREKDPKEELNWTLYKELTGIKDSLKIIKVKNTLNNILGMLRKSYNCVSINCSYETDFEKIK